VTGHGQYCPVSSAADVLGDRWTLLILREMVGGATRFNEIERCLPKVSRTLLTQRLRHLVGIGLLDAVPLPGGRGNEYHLTAAGRDLEPVLMAMGEWAVRWIFGEPRPDELDATFVMFWMHRRVHVEQLPEGRTVMRFDITGAERAVYWLVLQRDETSVCTADPGFETNVMVEADDLALHRVFAGKITWDEALKAGTISVKGPRSLTRQIPGWFAWSPFHAATRSLLTAT
jgi:DNA-binding HxlR family transcriptional regulator